MDENQRLFLQLSFNRFLRVAFHGSRVTSKGGLILVRELDEHLGFGELIDEHLTDFRANNVRFSLADLLRQSVYSRLAGSMETAIVWRRSYLLATFTVGCSWPSYGGLGRCRLRPDNIPHCDDGEPGPEGTPR